MAADDRAADAAGPVTADEPQGFFRRTPGYAEGTTPQAPASAPAPGGPVPPPPPPGGGLAGYGTAAGHTASIVGGAQPQQAPAGVPPTMQLEPGVLRRARRKALLPSLVCLAIGLVLAAGGSILVAGADSGAPEAPAGGRVEESSVLSVTELGAANVLALRGLPSGTTFVTDEDLDPGTDVWVVVGPDGKVAEVEDRSGATVRTVMGGVGIGVGAVLLLIALVGWLSTRAFRRQLGAPMALSDARLRQVLGNNTGKVVGQALGGLIGRAIGSMVKTKQWELAASRPTRVQAVVRKGDAPTLHGRPVYLPTGFRSVRLACTLDGSVVPLQRQGR